MEIGIGKVATYCTVSQKQLNLSLFRGTTVFPTSFPSKQYQKGAGNIHALWADFKFASATPISYYAYMGIAEVMHFERTLIQIREENENLEVTVNN